MEDQAAAGGGAREGGGVAQIAGDGLDIELVDAAAGPDQRADAIAAFEEHAGHMPAEEPEAPVTRAGFMQKPRARLQMRRLVKQTADGGVRLRSARPSLRRLPRKAYRSVHASIFRLSARPALMPSAAEGSKPQCTMQCSQRGSLPGP